MQEVMSRCGRDARPVRLHRTYMGGVERGERNLTLKSVERVGRGG